MKRLKIDLENCYGIRALKKEFDFSSKRLFIIYAANGAMKSSFAKAFQDLIAGRASVDRIHTKRVTNRSIKKEGGVDLLGENVFVIEPFNQDYMSPKISSLLASKTLKEQYGRILHDIDEKKEVLLKNLKPLSGLKSDEVEETLSRDILQDSKRFYEALLQVRDEVLEDKTATLAEVSYNKIFNEKAVVLLETQDLREKISDYINTYDALISSSSFFKKGVFNHSNAADIAKNLKDNGFFEANHSVFVNTKNKREIKTEKELQELIKKEKEAILKDPVLAKAFNEIDKKLDKNKEGKVLRDYLEQNRAALLELTDLSRFKLKLWVAYLAKSLGAFNLLMDMYIKGKAEIEKIVAAAKKEETQWQHVIEIFNRRFMVPFIVKIENQEDVILKSEAPNIVFAFKSDEGGEDIPVEKNVLRDVLSTGESRALYILNLIFEVEARREAQIETLFVIDDIADSFDYKNKYAIIEYLTDIARVDYFYQIILTHNYDFFRNLSSRLQARGEQKLHTIRTRSTVEMVKERYSMNPFKEWKDNLDSNEEMLIASIPFLRNLADYCGFAEESKVLTNLLHLKPETAAVTVGNLEMIIKKILRDKAALILPDHSKVIKNMIHDVANRICSEVNEIIDLEKKIVLSIAIRLKMEEILIKEIDDDDFVRKIEINQTVELIKEFKRKFSTGKDNIIKLADRVNLMTPENIHINSFMYEPILDMSSHHLKELYKNVCGV